MNCFLNNEAPETTCLQRNNVLYCLEGNVYNHLFYISNRKQ